jgi:hypothetical protein
LGYLTDMERPLSTLGCLFMQHLLGRCPA